MLEGERALESIGLVLEGGGMRGVYTAGVLQFFAEQELYFPYIVGVSAGACMAASYISRQQHRNRAVNIGYAKDPRYISIRNYFRTRELFGMDFIFDEIPNKLIPFDYETYWAAKEQFMVGTTNMETGQAVYFNCSGNQEDTLKVLRASSSLPFIAPIVEYKGLKLLDGGIVDPIPVRQAEKDGYAKNVVVLTRNKGYKKKPNQFPNIVRRSYKLYPEFVETMLSRHNIYNDTIDYIEQSEKEGKRFVIRPQLPVSVGRMERNPKKLEVLYNQGYEDAKQLLPALKAWMEQPE